MARLKNISCETWYKRLDVTSADLRQENPATLRHMLFHILLIREFESRLLDLKDWNQVHGPVHSSIGQEGGAAGVMQRLSREDVITSTHRGHHHFLAKACNAYAGNDYDPIETIPDAIQQVTTKALAEILGLAPGYCRGRGGSMHLGDRYSGCIGTNAIVAGGVPCATGAAWARRMNGTDRVSVAFLGDGAVHQGSLHEAMNMAALWKIPVIYFIENNLYAVATHVRESTSLEHLAQRGLGYGIPALVADGMDPLAVLKAMDLALEHTRSGKGPFLIEIETYRFRHQAQSAPGSAFGYRTKDEEAEWQKRDPAVQFPRQLLEAGLLTGSQHEGLLQSAKDIVWQAVEASTEPGRVEGTRAVRIDLFPGEEDLMVGVKSDGHEFEGARFMEREDFQDCSNRKLIDVIPEVLGRRLETDPQALILGEEVGKIRGGAFMATKELFKYYRDRVIDTPISENGFTGMALGLALSGKRPIVEIMYPDFALVSADQVFNQIGKCRYMYGNQYDIPVVFRTRVGIGTGYGAQHSMEPASLYALFPGWRIVAPSNPFDYVGLFNSAFHSLDPVLVIEHALLYPLEGQVPEDRDYLIELGKAHVAREGTDVTIIAYSHMVTKALQAANQLAERGISAEVIDLRSVDYAGIDYATIGASICKTNHVVICEEGLYCGGIGAQVADEIQRRFFDYLDAEIARVAGKPLVMPVSRLPESRAVPQVEDIVKAVNSIVSDASMSF